MATLREIKRRIRSINSTAKVTHAMELVAAAKMRKSQEAALSGKPYFNSLNEIIAEIKYKLEVLSHPLLAPKEADKQLIVLLTSDRGLVGGLNINLFREIAKAQIKNAKYIVVGKKGLSFVTKTASELSASFVSDKESALDLSRTLTKLIIDAYLNQEVNSVKILYPDFLSIIKQVPTLSQILPIEFAQTPAAIPKGTQTHLTLFEPSADEILQNLLPHYVLTRIYQAILEAKASEHSSRMVAMKNATDAANDLVDDLTLTYNQARQEAVTREL
ncbi:ATP synthase F1 subunit gamma, partial [Candidatus Curtissbacteria bacterium]|nr:ATP synthase F1 subunit gamma [Candidatus Curtissbacteria bacterium]